MALNISDMSDELRDELVAVFAWPTFDDVELRKFTTAVSTVVINHFKNNAELSAALADDGITGTVTGTDVDGTVDDDTVTGGIL